MKEIFFFTKKLWTCISGIYCFYLKWNRFFLNQFSTKMYKGRGNNLSPSPYQWIIREYDKLIKNMDTFLFFRSSKNTQFKGLVAFNLSETVSVSCFHFSIKEKQSRRRSCVWHSYAIRKITKSYLKLWLILRFILHYSIHHVAHPYMCSLLSKLSFRFALS